MALLITVLGANLNLPTRAMPTLQSDPSAATGEWSDLMSWPLVAVHMALLPNSEILMWDAWEVGRAPSARLWNPISQQFTGVPNQTSGLFCAGHAMLADGRQLVVGGHSAASKGIDDTNIFDPVTQTWSLVADMNYARWYPTTTTLADGRVLSVGGEIDLGIFAEIPEVYDPQTNTWTELTNSGWQGMVNYPRMHLVPTGEVFITTGPEARLFDVDTQTYRMLPAPPFSDFTSVMHRPGVVMISGGVNSGGSTAVIDLNQPNPVWRTTPSMNFGRFQHNLVLLPDGKVLAIGGSSIDSLVSTIGILEAEIWDPATETWSLLPAMQHLRLYHSTALLIPDGRVVVAGGGRLAPAVDYLSAEFYSPAYLFQGARPTITSAPDAVNYSESLFVATPDAGTITSVSFVRLGSTTHGFDMDQRWVPLDFTANGSGLNIISPPNPNVAPPGYYMMFLINADGVPSEARIIQLGGFSSNPIPTSTPIPSPTPTAIPGGQQVLTVSVSAGGDDANEDGASLSLNDSALWVGNASSSTSSYTGLRFSGLQLPRGAIIRGASLEFYSTQTQWQPIAVRINGEASGNSAPFGSSARPSQRALTAAQVDHSSNTQWLENNWYALAEVGPIVQEVINRADWQAGNSLALILQGTGSAWARKFIDSYENNPANAARLVIAYEAPPETTPTPTSPPTATATTTPTATLTLTPTATGTPDPVNQSPLVVVSESSVSVNEAQRATNSGTFSDPEGDPVTLAASVGSVATNADGTWAWSLITLDGPAQSQTVTLTATDNRGGSSTATFDLTVRNVAPGASLGASSTTITAGGAVTLTFSNQTDVSMEDMLTGFVYAFDCTNSGIFQITGSPDPSFDCVYPQVGTYQARGRIADKDGGWNDYLVQINVQPPPTATWTPTATATNTPLPTATPLPDNLESITASVSTGSDDVNEEGTSFSLNSNTVWVGTGGSVAVSYTGLRFGNLQLPPGAVIQSARLELYSTQSQWLSIATRIHGEASGNSAPFSSSARPSQRVLTAAQVDHSSNTQWLANTWYTLADVRAIVQEVVSQPNWQAGNNLALILQGSGGAWARKFVTSYESNPANAARLVIIYETGTAPTATDTPTATFTPTATAVPTMTSTPTATVTPDPVNQVPVIAAAQSVVTVDEAQTASNSGTFSDPEGDPVTLTASVGSVTANADGTWTWNFITLDGSAQSQTVTITATDDRGGSSTATFDLTVRNVAPEASLGASSASISAGGTVTLTFSNQTDASMEDMLAGFVYAFDCTNSGTFQITDSPTPSFDCVYPQAGTYQARGRIADKDGGANDYLVEINVQAPPTATGTPLPTMTATPLPTTTNTPVPTVTLPPTLTPTLLPSATPLPTATGTPLPTTTNTPVPTATLPPTLTPTLLPSATPLPTATNTPLPTATPLPPGMESIMAVVSAGSDDANEEGTSFSLNSNTVWVGTGSSAAASYTGLRFGNLTLPPGAVIQSARLELYSTQTQWLSIAARIRGEASGSSQPFSSSARPSQRALTAAQVDHSSNTQWLVNRWYTLADVRAIVQEVVNRPDWQSGNSLALILQGTGGAWGRKFSASYEINPANAARLVIIYEIPTAATSTPLPTATSVPTLTSTAPVTATLTPTNAATATLTATPTSTATATATATATLAPTLTSTATPTLTPTLTSTPTATVTPPPPPTETPVP